MEFAETERGCAVPGTTIAMFGGGWASLRVLVRRLWRTQKKRRTLLVRETAALGERRLVAVVQFERQRFLVGCSPASVSLIARLDDEAPASDIQ